MALLRFTFELFLGGAWVDVTTYVRHQKVNIQRGTRDEAPKLTPAKATLELLNADDRFNPRNPLSPYFGLLVRNTPLRISCSGGVSNAYRFYGEVFAFQPKSEPGRKDARVEIEANGALRRIIGSKRTPYSYYRSWVRQGLVGNLTPYYYWALEEGSDATGGVPDVGQGAATLANASVGGKAWGQARMNEWTPNGVLISNLNTLTFPCDMRGTGVASWQVSGIMTFGANETVAQIEINCGTATWYMQLYTVTPDYNTGQALVIRPDGTVALLGFTLPPLKEAGPIWFNFRASLSAGTLTCYWTWHPLSNASNSVSNTVITTMAATAQLYPRYVAVSSVANTADNTSTTSTTGLKDLSVSGCAIGSTGVNLPYTAAKAGWAEDTDARFARMLDEQGINNTASPFGSEWMGRQYIETLEDHLQEILNSARHSGIVESRTANELLLLGLATYRGDIDLTECRRDLEPAEDDKNTANIVRLDNSHAGQAVLTKATGDLSVAQVGPYDIAFKTNNYFHSDAVGLAGRVLAIGTWPGPRFVEISVSAKSTPAAYSLYRSIDVGDFFGLTGMASHGYYDLMIFRCTSIREQISHEDHVFTFTARPGELDWRLWTIGTNRLDLPDSTVSTGGSGSTIDVNVPTAKWSTTAAPFDIMISGERMTVTAVANLTSTTQRLTVTRSINGVVKAAPVAAEVHLYPAFFIKAV